VRVPRNKAAERAVAFINNLTAFGDFRGQPFRLRPWQERITRQIFGTLRPDGLRQYQKVFLFLPRKSGKSSFAAVLALYCLIGLPDPGQQILCVAGDREQASQIFRSVVDCVRADPYLSSIVTVVESQKRIVYERKGSFLAALSAEAPTKHGYNPSVVLFDELHIQRNRDLWVALTSGFGARKEPLTIAISTAGDDRTSLCYEEFSYAKKVAEGIVDDPTYLPVLYYAKEDELWDSEATWFRCNPALNDFQNLEFLRNECRLAKELPYRELVFRQLYLNQWVQNSTTFIPDERWMACSRPLDLQQLRDRECYAAVDLSTTTDVSALALLFPMDDGFYLLPTFWIPGDNARLRERRDHVPYLTWAKQGHVRITPGDVIDYDQIRHDIREFGEQFNIRQIAFDRWNATQLAGQLQGDGFDVVMFGQGFASMNEPTKEFERLILSGKLSHDGSPVMRWMMQNIAVETGDGGAVKLSKKRSMERIDGPVAAVMACGIAVQGKSQGPSVYEDRGILTF